jgi:hypothetical protein
VYYFSISIVHETSITNSFSFLRFSSLSFKFWYFYLFLNTSCFFLRSCGIQALLCTTVSAVIVGCLQWIVTHMIILNLSYLSVRPVVKNRQIVNAFFKSRKSPPQLYTCACIYKSVCVCVYIFMCQEILIQFTTQHPLNYLLDTNIRICTFENLFSYNLILKHITVTNIQVWRDMTLSHLVWLPNVLKEYMYLELLGNIHPMSEWHI